MRKHHGKWLLVIIWCLSIMTGLWVYGDFQITPFDPAMKLGQAASQKGFDADIVKAFNTAGITGGTIVHIESDRRCYCNSLSQKHQQSLSDSLAEDGYTFATLALQQHPALRAVIPSFPALALIDHNNQLRYLGPYATGLGCYTGDDLVAIIAALAHNETMPGAVVNSNVEGCYCNT